MVFFSLFSSSSSSSFLFLKLVLCLLPTLTVVLISALYKNLVRPFLPVPLSRYYTDSQSPAPITTSHWHSHARHLRSPLLNLPPHLSSQYASHGLSSGKPF